MSFALSTCGYFYKMFKTSCLTFPSLEGQRTKLNPSVTPFHFTLEEFSARTLPKSNISEFSSSEITNGKVWPRVLFGLSGKEGAGDALGQPPQGLTRCFCYPEPDRRVHMNPTGAAVTNGASSPSPVSIPCSAQLEMLPKRLCDRWLRSPQCSP